MKKLNIHLKHCYGIKEFKKELDFFGSRVVAIYASNGMMKTSFAKTFKNLSNGEEPRDELFGNNDTVCKIKDNDDNDIIKKNIFVIESQGKVDDTPKKIQPLLVNQKCQKEYEDAHQKIEKTKKEFIKKLSELSGLPDNNIEEEILEKFQKKEFFDILESNQSKIVKKEPSKFGNIKYNEIFNEQVIQFLDDSDVKKKIKEYMENYNTLLNESKYLQQGFDHYNADTIQKNLEKNGFFCAKHSINLNYKENKTEIKNVVDFEKIIKEEYENILKNSELRKKWDVINSKLNRNETLRSFRRYLEGNMGILPKLENLDEFAKEIWVSYFTDCENLFTNVLCEYKRGKEEIEKITNTANQEHGIWEDVIDVFNQRFTVPFKISIKNQLDVILKNDVPKIKFELKDAEKKVPVEEDTLLTVLSSGEARAWYILNIIFEVEARKKDTQETLFIIDDIADSFDYKNKYAIIQYLKDMSQETFFKLIILTHNFDFFRTIHQRGIVDRRNCYFVYKTNKEVKLECAEGIVNIFTKDLLKNLDDPKKLVASIPFVRNIIEYTKGSEDEHYKKLTSLLHCKDDTKEILLCDLKDIFEEICPIIERFLTSNTKEKVIDLIFRAADDCLDSQEGINFENKVVLSIGIRLRSEQYIIDKLQDLDFVSKIKRNQTSELIDQYKKENEGCSNKDKNIKIFDEVNLMTPENIHLNSFMYEPILDMSDIALKELYRKVKGIS